MAIQEAIQETADQLVIARLPGVAAGRSAGSGYGDLAFAVASADDKSGDVVAQSRLAFAKINRSLQALGSSHTRILSATVYLADLGDKPSFDRVWREWVGDNPKHWPQRACIGAQLSTGTRVELSVVAARLPSDD